MNYGSRSSKTSSEIHFGMKVHNNQNFRKGLSSFWKVSII